MVKNFIFIPSRASASVQNPVDLQRGRQVTETISLEVYTQSGAYETIPEVEAEIPNDNSVGFIPGTVVVRDCMGNVMSPLYTTVTVTPKKLKVTISRLYISVSIIGRVTIDVTLNVPSDMPYGNMSFPLKVTGKKINQDISPKTSLKVVPRIADGKIRIYCQDTNGKTITVREQQGNFWEPVVYPDISLPNYQLISKPTNSLIYQDVDQNVYYTYKSTGILDYKGTMLPSDLEFGNLPIQYSSDIIEKALDGQGNLATGNIILEDSRSSGGNGYRFKVTQSSEFIGSSTHNALKGVQLSFKTGDCTSASGQIIPGGNQVVTLQPGITREVIIKSAGQSGGKLNLPLTDFSVVIPKESRKLQDTYNTSLTWTF